MTRERSNQRYCESRKGAATFVFLILLAMIVVLGAFASDHAYFKLAQTDLRVAVDASTRAASAEYGVSRELDAAVAAAQEMAERYRVGSETFALDSSEVVSGTCVPQPDGTYEFVGGGTPINAFRIETGYTEQSFLGSMDLMFAAIHHVDQFQILSASTVAEIDLDIVLVLDRSGSMAFDLSGVEWQYPNGESWYTNYFLPPDSNGSRWSALDSALNVFVDVLDQKTEKRAHCGHVLFYQLFDLEQPLQPMVLFRGSQFESIVDR